MAGAETSFDNRIIPFYGGEHPELFEIERRCMDRDGQVIAFLDRNLPGGLVLDIGAGNGFTAERLNGNGRTVVALEPDTRMVDGNRRLIWAKGVAQDIPFHDRTFDAVYATWAFFFDGIETIEDGLREARRVVRPGGSIIIVDNAGGDEFTAFASGNIASSRQWWLQHGFEEHIIETAFKFDSLQEANRLLSFYFGEQVVKGNTRTEIGYRVAAYVSVMA